MIDSLDQQWPFSKLGVAQFAFGTKAVAVNYIASSDCQLVAQTPRPQSPVGQSIPSHLGPRLPRGPNFFRLTSNYGNYSRSPGGTSQHDRGLHNHLP